jgi:hypothetical protein
MQTEAMITFHRTCTITLILVFLPVCPMKELAGECPTGTLGQGPGDDVCLSPAGLGTCRGFDGEFAKSPPGDGCGNILGDGFIFGGKDGGEARLKEVAGLEPKLWC